MKCDAFDTTKEAKSSTRLRQRQRLRQIDAFIYLTTLIPPHICAPRRV